MSVTIMNLDGADVTSSFDRDYTPCTDSDIATQTFANGYGVGRSGHAAVAIDDTFSLAGPGVGNGRSS